MEVDGHILLDMPVDPAQVERSFNWLDGLTDSMTGVEALAAYIAKPYISMKATTAPATITESRRDEHTLIAAMESGKCAWIDWGAPSRIEGVVSNTLILDSAADLDGIEYVYAWQLHGACAVYAVAELDGTDLTLDDATGITPGHLIYPIRFGFLSGASRVKTTGPVRNLRLQLEERPKIGTVDATFEYFRSDISWSGFGLVDTYFIFWIDTSGSMSSEEDAITNAANNLKAILRDQYYGGDQSEADKWVKIYNFSNERWLDRISQDQFAEEANNYIHLCFINEAASGYHSTPRNAAAEPTTSFSNDYATYVARYAERDRSLAKIYSINPSSSSWEDDNEAFNAHVIAAVLGSGNYAALGTPLYQMGVSAQTGIPAGTDAAFYLQDIINLAQ